MRQSSSHTRLAPPDLKPPSPPTPWLLPTQNVLLTANGAVRLGDVGFSKLKEKTFITHGKTQSSCMCAQHPLPCWVLPPLHGF